ncbi:MAG: FAD:protein FMN transferase [Blautia sp.]
MYKKVYFLKRYLSSEILFLLLISLLSGCGQEKKEMVSKNGFFFDTMISIEIMEEKDRGTELLEECWSMCETYEKIFSRTRKDSELYQLNHRDTQEVQVSEDLFRLLSYGKICYERTEGKFDISVAPLSDLWDFKGDSRRIPAEQDLTTALEKVGYSSVQLQEPDRIIFENQDTMLDVGALAKGYIADRLKEYLVSQNVEKGWINLGGNVLTIGEKENGVPWRIGIRKPFGEDGEICAYVEVEDCSIVSSGIYERYFEKDGVLYYHVLDPDTGYPAETDMAQVTILSKNSLEGDGLSTSCLLMGYEKARAFIDGMEDTEAVFVMKGGEIRYTEGCRITLAE